MIVNINQSDRVGILEQEAEPHKSPSSSYTMRSGDLTATYTTTWVDALPTVFNLLPSLGAINFLGSTAAAFTMNYNLGHRYFGPKPAFPNLRCYRVDVEPLGQSRIVVGGGGLFWDEARLTAFYRAMPTTPLAELYEESMDPAFESLTMPARKLFWDAAGATQPLERDEAPRRQQQFIRWSYTILGMPALPTDILSAYQNHINTYAMTSPTYNMTFPAGTVLFRNPVTVPTVGMTGASLYDVTWEFIAKPEGATEDTWNKEFKAATASLQTVYQAAGAGAFVQYTKVDLNDLLLALP